MNGYYELKAGGETIGLKFGLPCVTRLEEKRQEGKLVIGHYTSTLLFYAHENYCAIKEKPLDKTLDFFCDLYEESLFDEEVKKEVERAVAAYNDSKLIQHLKEVGQAVLDEQKKSS